MTSKELIQQGKDYLEKKYPGYVQKPGRERRVLAAAWLNDVVLPREKTGANDGPVVEAILANVGLGKGNPWCAAAQALVADIAGVSRPKEAPASVMAGWVKWARGIPGRIIKPSQVGRGDLVAKSYGGGKGHIGIVIKNVLGFVYSIEGNTGPGNEGSQRDGQGMYRRVRTVLFWDCGIRGD